ncbi:C1 family peptidase [Flexivirga alba]|uniref:C1 family peptidase n=1 Tax=Flexivirga alba TaxID=702742 RepID=A0ABW2ANE7_9MICO
MAIELSQLQARVRELELPWTPGVTANSGHSLLQAQSRLGAVPPAGVASLEERQATAAARPRVAGAPAGVPATFDWRTSGGNYVTPIEDQGGCGSCVAFGAIAALESMVRIRAHNPGLTVDLSEAQLFFCYGPQHGAGACPGGGWWPDQAYACMADGIVDATCFPYTAANQACNLCPDWQTRLTKFTSSTTCNSITAMKQFIASTGPMTTCFTVYEDFYYHYAGGVYTYNASTSGNVIGGHCVCIVGYDDAHGCWIAKNSWGTGWGEQGFFRIAYGSAGIDAEMWGIDGTITSPLIPLTQSGKATTPMSVVARYPQHLDVFAVAPDGKTVSTWWDGSSGWGRWFWVGGGVASPGGEGSPVTSVSRFPDHLDLFTVGTDNRVYSCWWDASSGWASWFVIPGLTARPGSSVEVVSRFKDHLDLFTTDSSGKTMSTWWDASSGWANGWFQLAGGVAAAGSPVTAVSRFTNHLDVFTVGTDNRVYSCWWDASSGWSNWFALPGVTCGAGARVSVVSRATGNLDLFTTDTSGRIMSTWWNDQGGWANSWFQVSGGVASPGSDVTVLARYATHLDLFVVGTDNRVYSTWWDGSSGWANWFNVSGGVSTRGGQVASISRTQNHIDVFTTGTDGLVYSTWWDGSSGWAGWFQVT